MPNDRIEDGKATRSAPRITGAAGPFDVPYDQLDRGLLKTLFDAALSPERSAADAALAAFAQAGVPAGDVADHYIPAVARIMGEQWCSDEMAFATVTIGCARLQSMLRELGPAWSGDTTGRPDAPVLLLVVPQEVYHTLGAMVLAGQLRRAGASVRIMLGATPAEVRNHVARADFDGVLLSGNCGDSLENLRQIIKSVRNGQDNPPPVIVGGSILSERSDIGALTGADLVTSDPVAALRLCGLKDPEWPTPDEQRAHELNTTTGPGQ